MTKYELYNELLESAFEQINNNEEFNVALLKMVSLLDHPNAGRTIKIKEEIINSCISAGIIAAINYFDLSNVPDSDSDLFAELTKQMSGKVVDFDYMLKTN